MTTDEFDFVALQDLRVGLFVDLDLGWMAHPFPTSRFKIANTRQIETLRGLGVERIRYIPSKSDAPLQEAAADAQPSEIAASSASVTEAPRVAIASLPPGDGPGAAHCERRFSEVALHYRTAVDQVDSNPRGAAALCQSLVEELANEMAQHGDVAIRLLTEAAGDKSAMHPVNVSVLSLLLGKAMGLDGETLQDLGVAALMHDLGKSQLPERVRRWDANFSLTEQKAYQDHVARGVVMARAMGLRTGAITAIAQHHELVDGSGFPLRLKGEALSMNARILAVVNRYDGLCNPAKPSAAMTPHEALAAIFAQQKARFDGSVLSAFIRMMGVYPPGSVVQLSDERHAMVVSVNSARPLKPRVMVHEPSVPRHRASLLDLECTPNTSIRRSLKPSSLSSAAMSYLQPKQRICYFFEPAANAEAVSISA